MKLDGEIKTNMFLIKGVKPTMIITNFKPIFISEFLTCSILNPFPQALRKAMKGLGTNDTALIRVVVTRAEIDMQYIKAEYHKKYHKQLSEAIHSETSAHYRTFLLALVGPNH